MATTGEQSLVNRCLSRKKRLLWIFVVAPVVYVVFAYVTSMDISPLDSLDAEGNLATDLIPKDGKFVCSCQWGSMVS